MRPEIVALTAVTFVDFGKASQEKVAGVSSISKLILPLKYISNDYKKRFS